MPDLLTPQALATGKLLAGPLVLETFFKHFLSPKSATSKSKAREDLIYDEAFVLMKTFLETATKYPVAALQRFGLVRTPAPPWVALHRVIIPQQTLVRAAAFLVEAFGGDDMAYKVAGGTKWWQVRAGPGVEAEWIVMKKDWNDAEKDDKARRKASEGMVGEDGGVGENGEFRREMDELRCMLYIHGGAYYWGSINTHRYAIWRFARKMRGRCFAVNYRKAPQYPFPCAVQDCLAAYLYLVNPPPGFRHKPVEPKNIVIAGDSAGGGLVWALLQILRDTDGLALPAGAVLISPWSDLTHSFPSILTNTATDIVPPFGFIHKPSSLWPPPPPALTDEMQNRLRSKIKEAVSRMRNDPSRAEVHHRRASVFSDRESAASPVREMQEVPEQLRSSDPRAAGTKLDGQSKSDLHPVTEKVDNGSHPEPQGEPHHKPSRANPGLLFQQLEPLDGNERRGIRPTTLAQDSTPLSLEVDGESVAIDTQIQLYATNGQLCHPWVSPVLGYLGGLPPLYICCGANEVLRDEIIYIAHKAANPEAHRIREDVRELLPSLKGIEEKHGPTRVHLQVYDGTCHDLPLFSMTKPARGVFRAISSFARYVTPSALGSLSINSSALSSPDGTYDLTTETPGVVEGNAPILDDPVTSTPPFLTPAGSTTDLRASQEVTTSPPTLSQNGPPNASSARPLSWRPRFDLGSRQNSASTSKQSLAAEASGSARPMLLQYPTTAPSGDDAGGRFREDHDRNSLALPGTAGHPGIYRGPNPFKDFMIRERVATDGACRPLEAESELSAMTMPLDEVGVIKEGPAIRYLTGQALWDKKFGHALKSVAKHRKRNLEDARKKDAGKIAHFWQEQVKRHHEEKEKREMNGDGTDWETDREAGHQGDILDRSWSWSWALKGEAPPSSAIVSRRDLGEARDLALMADRMDSSHGSPVNGLSIWVGLAALFSSSSDRKRAHEVLTKAKADIETQREGSRATSGMRRDGDKTERGTDKGTGGATRAVRRMSKALRLRKKPPDTALKKEGVEQEV